MSENPRLTVTLPLTLAAFTLALCLAVPLGIVAAARADRAALAPAVGRAAARRPSCGSRAVRPPAALRAQAALLRAERCGCRPEAPADTAVVVAAAA